MKLAVFAGTAEGRVLCGRLSEAGIGLTACVATEYGRELMPDLPGVAVRAGRMGRAEMAELLKDYDTVADATHPYAAEVT